jgi:hypothetical protein
VRFAVQWNSLLGGRLAMDGARLNFLTDIYVRASHYRLSAGSTTRGRAPAGENDLLVRRAERLRAY